MSKFKLGDKAVIKVSGEEGTVVGLATYLSGGDQVQLHYCDRHGCSKTDWLVEDLLVVSE